MVSSTTSRTLDSSPAVTIYIDLPFDRSSTLGTWWTLEQSQFAASNVVSGQPCTLRRFCLTEDAKRSIERRSASYIHVRSSFELCLSPEADVEGLIWSKSESTIDVFKILVHLVAYIARYQSSRLCSIVIKIRFEGSTLGMLNLS
jgi:hypothetical protein